MTELLYKISMTNIIFFIAKKKKNVFLQIVIGVFLSICLIMKRDVYYFNIFLFKNKILTQSNTK